MLGDRLDSFLDIVLLHQRQLDFSIQIQKYGDMLDSMPGVDTVFDVRQTFFERAKTFLGLLFQLLEPVLEVIEVRLSRFGLHELELEVIQDPFCFQE